MAIKKTELYSSLWSACDALRGGMDASQYKDYVLVMLFWRYVSDKAKSDPRSLIEVPAGCGFDDLVALKGQSNIHEQMDKAIGALARANDLQNVIDVVSFQDEEKLGRGKEMVDRLSDLISIFQNPALDFTKNKASGDDLLGDAYEYLMMNFATESGKSKGQFYTPAEVSRILAEVLEVNPDKEGQSIYDPTCGSGSLLLKVSDVIHKSVSLFGQEKDSSTAALAKMNMILHGSPTAEIARGQSTLSDPQFKDERGGLKTFDYVVANPPFSYDKWTYGFHPEEDIFRRFDGFGLPPLKNGDYAFLLHIVASLKPNGKAAVILPHGVLFRGNAEGEIRKNLIQRGLIKAVIGLPGNLFYGTGIPACVIVIDKEGANSREEVFFVNAANGFAKDGAKNRLRERDIRKIVDVFKDRQEIRGFSKAVPVREIGNEKNSFNLNIPRYIDSSEQQDIQDIEAHLKGGIPLRDIEGLNNYWQAFPTLKNDLFENLRPGYLQSKVPNAELRQFILEHSDLNAFRLQLISALESWERFAERQLMSFEVGASPREMLVALSEKLKSGFSGVPLIDGYAMFQHLMDYWNSTLQDDLYIITQDGWKAIPYRIQETKKGKSVDKGWACDLIPKLLIVERYFKPQSDELASLEIELESLDVELENFTEEQNQEGGVFFTTEKVNKASANKLLKELKGLPDTESEVALLSDYLKMVIKQAEIKSKIKNAAASIDQLALRKYGDLTEDDVKDLVVRGKWFHAIKSTLEIEIQGLLSTLIERVRVVSERYDTPLPKLDQLVNEIEEKVNSHLQQLGYKEGVMQELLRPKEGWSEIKLGELCTIFKGKGLPKSAIALEGQVPCIHYGELFTKYGRQIIDVYSRTSSNENSVCSLSGDVLMPASDVTPNGLAVASFIQESGVVLGGDILIIRPRKERLNGLFLAYYLTHFKSKVLKMVSGSTVYHLYGSDLKEFTIEMPPLEEQKAIAQVLSDFDNLIDGLEHLFAKKRRIKEGVMQELLTGKTRLV